VRSESAARFIECPTCAANAELQAERAAFLAAHPMGSWSFTVKTTPLRVRITATECNGECQSAKSDKCACSCGGHNHGIAA
jgi:hypothetical protein